MHKIIGNSPHIVRLRERIAKVAPTDSKILVFGESGSGKELVAAAIHENSTRKNKPFIALNCAAVPESLLEAEIFGFEKGSFTGATARRQGVFERANGGTLFLDEIGDMPLTMQAKLLRVLQSGTFERIGGHETIQVDVRVVAATNKNLRKAVEDRAFREDLYHRIAVIPVQSPPLRARGTDITLLAKAFLAVSARPLELTQAACDLLLKHRWPGNVRELQNVVQRLVAMVTGDTADARDVQQAVTLDEIEHDYFDSEAPVLTLPPPVVITPDVHAELEATTPPETGASVPIQSSERVYKLSEETRRKMSESHRRVKIGDDVRLGDVRGEVVELLDGFVGVRVKDSDAHDLWVATDVKKMKKVKRDEV